MWAEYDRWNEAVLDVVFPELEVPEPVYLDLEEDVLADLGRRLGVEPGEVEDRLSAAVAATLLTDEGPSHIFAGHVRRLRSWQRSNREGAPPFLALLATFCMAAEQMAAGDGMSQANYFGRLRAVLGWDSEDRRLDQAYRRVAERVWSAHNAWLLDLDGARGLPTAFALTHRYVGLSVSQALVRSGDRERFKDFFRQYGFAPGADVPPSELAMVLDGWFSHTPCPASANLERLWRGQARSRIALAASVALAGWDGSVRTREARGDEREARGHLALTLEVGGFPSKRFSIQALLYLPEPGVARDATVLTASEPTTVSLVPDVQGALGLGRASSLHAGDALEGVLQIRDDLTGTVLERRPRRLVLFREDELTRRWVESPQVMLGDDVRLLVKHDLMPRLTGVLNQIARPGWDVVVDGYAGQPAGWVLVTGVEVFGHPGDLVHEGRMDDLSPLVPLTSNQLKIAGGFSLPGRSRGKWHSSAAPEIRAVSDTPQGFEVRLYDLHRYDDGEADEQPDQTLLEVWSDNGAGVVVAPMADLQLEDGDYRVELIPQGSDEPLTSTDVRLRSGDTPDLLQWATIETVSYSSGVGALGVRDQGGVSVQGLVVDQPAKTPLQGTPPGLPWWSTGRRTVTQVPSGPVRLTMPDAESCIYTGRHREEIDMVPTDGKGRPTVAWSYGRCRGCGLVRRYPTKLPRSGFERRVPKQQVVAHARNDVAVLPAATPTSTRSWDLALDALMHTGGGSWGQLEKIALQVEPTALFVDQFARTLEVLGHLDVARDSDTLSPEAWEVSPTVVAGTAAGTHLAGYWPEGLRRMVSILMEDAGGQVAREEGADRPTTHRCDLDAVDLRRLTDEIEGLQVLPSAWHDLVAVLPSLSTILDALPRQSESVIGEIRWYQPKDNSWLPVSDCKSRGAFRASHFSNLDFVRTEQDLEEGTIARSTVQLGKHLAALMEGRPLLGYDSRSSQLHVPLGADLPGLYGRAVVAASGRPPVARRAERVLIYEQVPAALAGHLHDLFSR